MAESQHTRILLVDDDAGHTELVRRNLRRFGIANPIETLSNGSAALDYVFRRGEHAARATDGELLILLDINMPGGVDGVEVLRQIKADPATRTLPVIMLTTTDDPREIERCRAHGCDGYVTKPIDPRALIEAVRRLASAPGRAPQGEEAHRR
jgi:CheY-like chemotaxis protein